jgi:transcriptional regulator with XRE-family HTH domain
VPKPTTRDLIHSAVIASLQKRREELGLSMTQVAEKSGLSLSMISFVEREIRKPTLASLLRIAEALDVDLWKLLRDATRASEK